MKAMTYLMGVAAALSLGVGSALAQPASQPAHPGEHAKDGRGKDHVKEEAMKEGVKVGEAAPAIALKDTDGKDVSLADLSKAGKIVVVYWFNPDCPLIKKHHEANKTFVDMYAKFKDKNVAFIAVNSGKPGEQGTGKDRNAKAREQYGMTYPVVLDESGAVGHAYGAKTTPHCFVVGADGKIAYMGAIDDDPSPRNPGKTNYVAKALDELLAKKSVSTPETRPYGCGVKYGH